MIYFFLRAIFTFMLVFTLLSFAMGTLWAIKIRSIFKHTLHTPKPPPPAPDKNVIEGEYKVIDEKEVK